MRIKRSAVGHTFGVLIAVIALGVLVSTKTAFATLAGSGAPPECGTCHTATLLGASSHDFHTACNGSSGYKGQPNTCHSDDEPGTCSDYHESCGVEEDYTTESVARLVREGAGQELVALMSKHGDRLTFNSDRNAVQVLDCDGHVAANLPVTPDVAQALMGASD